MAGAVPTMGGGSISSKPACADRPHYHSGIFFCSAAIFERELAGFVAAPNLGSKKISLCRILTEMV